MGQDGVELLAQGVRKYLDVRLSESSSIFPQTETNQILEGQLCQDPAWRVGGEGGITADNVILIGLIHVTHVQESRPGVAIDVTLPVEGWQPILQLDRYIIPQSPNVL